ncbi:uncharacterized protein HKW66_Vig0236860 [Vigna angularis]|uniref:Uncharacterized protein n=1 Tax=Phaseolus angularis TaxID=3914 RepID=A0A8T0KTB8_PHAAN|nr:uncharacterized protein HKW66_Vig0236860 [Vigna angularis]
MVARSGLQFGSGISVWISFLADARGLRRWRNHGVQVAIWMCGVMVLPCEEDDEHWPWFRKIFGIGDFSVWVSAGVCERVLLQWSWWMAVLAALRRPEKCLMVEMEVEEDAKDDDGGLATLAFAFCIGNGGGYRRRCWCWVMARLRQDGRVADGGLRLSMVLAAQGS